MCLRIIDTSIRTASLSVVGVDRGPLDERWDPRADPWKKQALLPPAWMMHWPCLRAVCLPAHKQQERERSSASQKRIFWDS